MGPHNGNHDYSIWLPYFLYLVPKEVISFQSFGARGLLEKWLNRGRGLKNFLVKK